MFMFYNMPFLSGLFFSQYLTLLVFQPLMNKVISSRHCSVMYTCSLFFILISLLTLVNFCVFEENSWVYNFDSLVKNQNFIDFNICISVDSLSLFFALLVVFIGFATNIYTFTYFKGEADEKGFIFWLNAFIASMLILVFAGNFFTIFLGWELIGLTSFFLINFWRTKRSVVKSSFKAVAFNLISDVFLLGALVYFYNLFNTSNCHVFFTLLLTSTQFNLGEAALGCWLLIICCAIKSVQFICHLWLPDSMEAPVPASALIHSATLVSAGVYLLCRFNCLIHYSGCLSILITVGAVTAAYGGVVAAAQTDLKKLLAYSTMSHCGFLWILASSGNVLVTVLYLYLHGLFKAATFYCAGSFIRSYNTQDSRWMGSGSSFLRLDSFLLIFCASNLAGLPFSIGVYYKIFFLKIIFLLNITWWQLGFIFIGMLSGLVYYYRLTNYAIFDFYKNVKAVPNVYLLYTKIRLGEFRLVPKNHVVAVIFLIIIALVTLYIMWWGIVSNVLSFESIHEELSTLNISQANLDLIYQGYFIFFYTTYLIIFIMLSVVMCRPNIFAIESLITIMFFSIFLLVGCVNVWGHIMTEANTINNFNFGFSTHKSDILIHLSQWQYWWWFWFSIFWVMYFFIITRVLTRRTMQFNPIINTSVRGHGKWGDFLVAIIPLSWCGNILINSNFILRMIEWQNESSLFTVRIQGKQWYWVYKFDATAAYNILAAPKNIGHNRWFVTVPGESYCADNYYQALLLGAQLEYKNMYFKLLKDEGFTQKKLNTASLTNNAINFDNFSNELTKTNNTYALNKKIINNLISKVKKHSLNNSNNLSDANFLLYKNYPKNFFFNGNSVKKHITGFYDFSSLDDSMNFAANIIESIKTKPIKFIRGVINKHNFDILKNENKKLTKNILFVAKFNNANGSLEPKVDDCEILWGFKQKKYKRLQKFKFLQTPSYDPISFEPSYNNAKKSPFVLKSTLVDSLTSKELETTAFNYQRSIKYNRQRQELVPVNLARRLLRTKRTLVLPAHVNITLITNSYDVVHSWFIPGLGIKLDCVPGRSTHHTFYIDNIGFYYGQCAEICGRYHHHMPIRLCALPFEQFLVWWQKKGLKRLHRISVVNSPKAKIMNPNDLKFKYKW